VNSVQQSTQCSTVNTVLNSQVSTVSEVSTQVHGQQRQQELQPATHVLSVQGQLQAGQALSIAGYYSAGQLPAGTDASNSAVGTNALLTQRSKKQRYQRTPWMPGGSRPLTLKAPGELSPLDPSLKSCSSNSCQSASVRSTRAKEAPEGTAAAAAQTWFEHVC
jgi:hypothetical protein